MIKPSAQVSFSEQHHELVQIAASIMQRAKENTPASIVALTQLRLALSRSLRKHVTAEVSLVRRAGKTHGDAPASDILRKYHDELLAWQGLLIKCNVKWSPKAISAHPQGFIDEYQPIYRALKERVRWEEEVFYPYILSVAHLDHRAT